MSHWLWRREIPTSFKKNKFHVMAFRRSSICLLLAELWRILFWIIISSSSTPPQKNINYALLNLIPFLDTIILKLKSQFRINSVDMNHTNFLIKPYSIWLFNLLCPLLFMNLWWHNYLTTWTLMVSQVKFISWWL